MCPHKMHNRTSEAGLEPCRAGSRARSIASKIVLLAAMRLGPEESPPLQDVADVEVLVFVGRSPNIPAPATGASDDDSAINMVVGTGHEQRTSGRLGSQPTHSRLQVFRRLCLKTFAGREL